MDGGAGSRLRDQRCSPSLETQAVDEDDVRLGHRPGIGDRGLVEVGVGVWPDDCAYAGEVADDLLHHVAQNREAGDNLHLWIPPLGRCGSAQAEQRQRCRDQTGMNHFHERHCVLPWGWV